MLLDPGSEITLVSAKALQRLRFYGVSIVSKKRLGFTVAGLNSGGKPIKMVVTLHAAFQRVQGHDIPVKFDAWVYDGHMDQDIVWGVNYFNWCNMSIVGSKHVSDRQLFVGKERIKAEIKLVQTGPHVVSTALCKIAPAFPTLPCNMTTSLGVVTETGQLLEAEDSPNWKGEAPSPKQTCPSPDEVLAELGVESKKQLINGELLKTTNRIEKQREKWRITTNFRAI